MEEEKMAGKELAHLIERRHGEIHLDPGIAASQSTLKTIKLGWLAYGCWHIPFCWKANPNPLCPHSGSTKTISTIPNSETR
jgi:hypothetical protein